MSLEALTSIWRAPPCKGGDLLCLLAIADNADDFGYAWPSIKTIARKAAMSERGAQKCLRKLEESGLIVVQIGGGRGSANSYQITTNGMGEKAGHKNPEQNSPNSVHPLPAENPEQSDINPEQNDAKPRTPVHPNPIEPSKEQYCAADAPHHDDFDFDGFFVKVCRAYPKEGSWRKTEDAVSALLADGANPEDILAAARAYAVHVQGWDAPRIFLPQNFFAKGEWEDFIPASSSKAIKADLIGEWAKEIANPTRFGRLSDDAITDCFNAGLVTAAQIRAAKAVWV